MYTASQAFFDALWAAGVSHCFVNLGSDHPSIIEALAHSKKDRKGAFPEIITCPNEMVAMSMADGFARYTGKPQCVIVHVDVGTQGFGAAVHNASTGRAPVLLFAGLSPFTLEGELRGSRTEFIHWIQDVPDQKQIVAQYCRYTAELKTGVNIKQMVNRALQFSTSAPQGPVYLCGAREVMEEEVKPIELNQNHWKPVRLGGLPEDAVEELATSLAQAQNPLFITSYSGRNHDTVPALVELANLVPGLKVVDAGGSDMCFPANHEAWVGLRYGSDPVIPKADVILLVDCDVPWIPTICTPSSTARIFHIDVDPLKQMMPLHYVAAEERFRADALTSLQQIVQKLQSPPLSATLQDADHTKAKSARAQEYSERIASIQTVEIPHKSGGFGSAYLCKQLRELCPEDTLWVVEAVTNTVLVHNSIRPTHPGSWLNCGGGGLGWSGGASLGIKLATMRTEGGEGKFVVQIVGDGTFLFSVPGSVYWISRRYKIPTLTIVLNNNGWHAPRRSLLLVHPEGEGSRSTNEEINLSFDPSPDYAGIAKAAAGGELHADYVSEASTLSEQLKKAIDVVKSGKSAVLDCAVVSGC